MRKLLFFILGLLAAGAAIFLVASGPYTLATQTGINPDIIDSEVDKLFYLLMVWGCGMVYAMVSVCLFKSWNPVHYKPVLYTGMVSAFAFFAGLYYHMIFNSPW